MVPSKAMKAVSRNWSSVEMNYTSYNMNIGLLYVYNMLPCCLVARYPYCDFRHFEESHFEVSDPNIFETTKGTLEVYFMLVIHI